jgi:hypothetical protein
MKHSSTLTHGLKVSFFSLAILGLQSCTLTPPANLMDIQAGQVLILKQPLQIPPQSARIYIQHGQVTGQGFDHYEPHCRFEIKELRDKVQTLAPGFYKINRVRIGEEQVAQIPKKPFLNVTYQQAWANDSDQDSNRVETMDYVHLYLENNDSNLLRLTCSGSLSDGNPLDEPRSHRPEQKQINQILQTIAKIQELQ